MTYNTMTTYMTRACDLSATLPYASNKNNIDKLCIDFITALVLMVTFAVILMVALIY